MKKIEDVILFQIDQTSKISKKHSQKEFDKLKLGITVEQWVILKTHAKRGCRYQRTGAYSPWHTIHYSQR